MRRFRIAFYVVAALLLGWLSYPTWSSLIAEQGGQAYSESEYVRVTVNASEVQDFEVKLDARFRSATEDPGRAQPFAAGMDVRGYLKPEIQSSTVLIDASPSAARIVDECLAQITPDGRQLSILPGIRETSRERAFDVWQRGVGSSASSIVSFPAEAKFYELDLTRTLADSVVAAAPYVVSPTPGRPDCLLPSSALWSERVGKAGFSTPRFEVQVKGRVPTLVEFKGTEHQGLDGNTCASVVASWGPGVDLTSVAPAGREFEQDGAPDSAGQGWVNCVETNGDLGGYLVAQPGIFMELTDTLKSELVTRNLVLAGLLLGVVGALLVECLKVFSEVLEGWISSKKIRKPGTEPAKTGDEVDVTDWDPDKRGYL